ncbi:hypothetical protein HGRIS_000224 [Hohenbuehelia grisea]|uniref:F-box domain-containing protein n=1 Tax=Hohenbuehelia grisea TaxID=104357 RepID=A0ABR3JQK0_9AGAR
MGQTENSPAGTSDPDGRPEELHIVEQRAAIAPIDRLPVEVLEQIMEEVYFPPLIGLASSDLRESPWTFALVSRRWRDIACQHQPLWATIWVDIERILGLESHWTIAPLVLAILLERSSGHPLDISVTYRHEPVGPGFNPFATLLHRIYEVLIPHSYHWQDVWFSLTETTALSFARVRGHSPMLRNLRIDFGNFGEVRHGITINAFEVAPRLKALHFSVSSTCFLLPWAQITRASLQELRDETPALIGRMHNLRELSLDLSDPSIFYYFSTTTTIPASTSSVRLA